MAQTPTPDDTAPRPALGYALSLTAVAAITVILSVVQSYQMAESGEYVRPYGMLYLLAVALIAARWGGRQGFLALALSLAAIKCFLMLPHFSPRVRTASDGWELGALALVGTLLILALAELRTSGERARRLLDTVSTQQSELQAVLDGMTEGLILGDLQGNVLDMNPAALRLHGFDSVAQARLPLAEFSSLFELQGLDWKPIPITDWPLARVLRGEHFSNMDVRVRRCDTGRFWDGSYAGTQICDKDGHPLFTLLTIRDVTEQQTMREALRLSEEHLRLVMESAQVGTWHWDLDTDAVRCSPQCRALFGLPLGDDLTFAHFLDPVHPDDRRALQSSLADAQRDRFLCLLRHRVVWPDGTVHWVVTTAQAYGDIGGDPVYMEGVVQSLPSAPSGERVFVATPADHLPVPLPQ